MTPHQDSTGIVALDELGRRFEAAAARPRRRRLRRRHWPALALGVLALAATPALAAVLGGPERVEDALPQVGAAIDRGDPAATGRALAERGFRVQWVLITDNPDPDGETPTVGRNVSAPPAGTEILSVLNAKGGNEVGPGTRDLQVEIAPVGSDILESHR